MLHADREQAARLGRDRLAGERLIAEFDPFGPLDHIKITGHGQAALAHDLLAVGADDLRVDQIQRLVFLFRQVDNGDPLLDIDLGRGQADAALVVHGLQHVRGDPFSIFINALHRRRLLPQALIREM